jgi:hypothetical protein
MAGMRSGYVQRNDARRHDPPGQGVIEGRGLKLEYTPDLTAIGKPVRLGPPPAARVLDARKP